MLNKQINQGKCRKMLHNTRIICIFAVDEKAYTNQQAEFHDHGNPGRDVGNHHVDCLRDYQGFHGP